MSENEQHISENMQNESETNQELDLEALKNTLIEEQEKSEKHLANWQRSEADFSNYRKRAEQERNDAITFGNSALIKRLLPVIDDMDRAFAALPPKLATNNWVKGIDLVYRKLHDFLQSEEVTAIEAIGKPFDPNLHDAYCQQNGPEGVIVAEAEKGYMYKDKILRASKVMVGNGTEESNITCETDVEQ